MMRKVDIIFWEIEQIHSLVCRVGFGIFCVNAAIVRSLAVIILKTIRARRRGARLHDTVE